MAYLIECACTYNLKVLATECEWNASYTAYYYLALATLYLASNTFYCAYKTYCYNNDSYTLAYVSYVSSACNSY